MKDTIDWQKTAAKWFCCLAVLGILWSIFRYAWIVPAVLLFSFGVASVIAPLARKTAKKTHLPFPLCAFCYVLILLLFLGTAAVVLTARLVGELEKLLIWLGDNEALIEERSREIIQKWEALTAYLPGGKGESDGMSMVHTIAENFVRETMAKLGRTASTWLGRLVRLAPNALISGVVTVMACFYGSMSYDNVCRTMAEWLPKSRYQRAERVWHRAIKGILGYLRAYGLLWLLTFSEVLIGLLILRQPYAFLMALVIAAVDILPILGTGTVLIPWAVGMFLLGRPSFGIGLLILYGVVTIVRQIAEPHILGGSLGIPPLMSLLFSFAGLHFFGLPGMILGSAVAVVVKEIWQAKKDMA